jgi:hypothetical protein
MTVQELIQMLECYSNNINDLEVEITFRNSKKVTPPSFNVSLRQGKVFLIVETNR